MVSRVNTQPPPPAVTAPKPQAPAAKPAPPPPPVAKRFGTEFSSGRGSALRARALATTGANAATTLRTEVVGDGRANCLERAVKLAQPGDRVMLLHDGDGVGHAVVLKPNGQVVDPNHPDTPAKSIDAYLAANPRYTRGPAVPDQLLERALSIPPGPQRDLFLRASGLSAIANERVADGGGTVIAGTIGTAGQGDVPDPSTWPTTTSIFLAPGYETARVRGEPATNGAVTGSFKRDEPLTVLNQSPPAPAAAQWYQVSGTGADGKPLTGWVGPSVVHEPGVEVAPEVNARMEALGYVEPGGTVDANDLRNFQVMNGLEPTGEFDAATMQAMWSPDARISTFVTQFQTATYNATKDGGGSNNCGPASVAMNLAALGLATVNNADPQALIADVRGDTGTTAPDKTGPAELKAAARANGAVTRDVKDMDGVDAALARGEPVVLYGHPNQAGSYYDSANFGAIGTEDYHWISVVGKTADGQYIIQDPLSRNGVVTVSRDELEVYAVWTTSNGDPSSFSMRPAPQRHNIPE